MTVGRNAQSITNSSPSQRLTAAWDSLSLSLDEHFGCARIEAAPTSPAHRSYPGDRRPQRPQRLPALASGRTDTMIALVLSSIWTPPTTAPVNPNARCHTLLFYTLFCSPWFLAVRQRENLGADRVQPRQHPSDKLTDRAGERDMCGAGVTGLSVWFVCSHV